MIILCFSSMRTSIWRLSTSCRSCMELNSPSQSLRMGYGWCSDSPVAFIVRPDCIHVHVICQTERLPLLWQTDIQFDFKRCSFDPWFPLSFNGSEQISLGAENYSVLSSKIQEKMTAHPEQSSIFEMIQNSEFLEMWIFQSDHKHFLKKLLLYPGCSFPFKSIPKVNGWIWKIGWFINGFHL
jgi:hypothetical protein